MAGQISIQPFFKFLSFSMCFKDEATTRRKIYSSKKVNITISEYFTLFLIIHLYIMNKCNSI